MQKLLFIDRDGTLVIEPPEDYQLDSLEKLEFYPGVFRYLSRIAEELDYRPVMVTNQDGLGTASFPEEDFWPAQNKIIQAFKNEGIEFLDVLIDKSLPEENKPTRKPGTAMLTKYIKGDYDLKNSFVIGDRISDVQLAKNLGCKSIFINEQTEKSADFSNRSWKAIYEYLKSIPGSAKTVRKTSETEITAELELYGSGKSDISSGIGFLDHMLEQIAKHGNLNLKLNVKGDLEVDAHHSIEDAAIVLGESFKKALGNKAGIARYGFSILPMDESLAQVALDFSGRPYLVWNADFKREAVGEFPTEMFKHFFKSFCDTAGCNLNIKAEGENEHHKIEAVFKAFAKAVKQAVSKTGDSNILSTKGQL
jgi:imidazoleglycerol-phosphate dehydratase/histidinol-phosphatase